MSLFNQNQTLEGIITTSQLDIISDQDQIVVGSQSLTTIDIDTSTERTLIIPDTAGNAEFVLAVDGVITGTIENAEYATESGHSITSDDSLHADHSDTCDTADNALHADTADTATTATLADNSLLLNGLINSTTGTSTNTIVQRGTYGQTNLGRTNITALGSNTNILSVKDTGNNNMLNISNDDITLGSVGHPVQLFLNGSEILPSTIPPTPSLQDCLDKSITDNDNPMLVSSKPFTIKGTHATQDIFDVYDKDNIAALRILNNGKIRPTFGLDSAYAMTWYLTFPISSYYIKFGYTAGSDNIANGSIVLGDIYTTSNSGFFVSQVRQVSSEACGNILVFDSTTKEIRYISGLNIIEGDGISATAISANSLAVESDSTEIVKVTNALGEISFKIDNSNDEIVIGEPGNLMDVVVDTTFVIDHTLNQVRIGSVSNNNDLLVNDVVVQVNPDLQQIYDNNPASNLEVDNELNISRSDNNDNALAVAVRNSSNTIVISLDTSGDFTCGDITCGDITSGAITSDTTTCNSLISDNLLVYKNVVINGDMVVHQRGNQNISPANSGSAVQYTLDRWQAHFTNAGPCTFSVSQEDTPTTTGSPYFDRFRKYLKFSRTTTSNSSASHSIKLMQNIEGNDVWHYYLGKSSCRPMVLSFWFIAYTTGIYSVAVQNSAVNKTYKSSFSVTGNTWGKHVVYITPITTGTWLTDVNEGLRIVFDLGNTIVGRYDTTTDTWTSNNSTFKTGGHNLGASSSSSDFIGVTGVQIEEGEAYTGFEYIPYQIQLKRCERYFYEQSGYYPINVSRSVTTNHAYSYMYYHPVTMRITPSVSFGGGLYIKNIVTTYQPNVSSITLSGGNEKRAGSITFVGDATLSGARGDECYVAGGYINWSAEL